MAHSVTITAILPSPPSIASRKHLSTQLCGLVLVPRSDVQERSKRLKITCSLLRRDALIISSGAMLTTLLSTDSAEAVSRVKPETKKKILENLEKLKEKAGIPSKEKKPNLDSKLPPMNPPNEEKKPNLDGKLPPTNPPNSMSRPLVETDLTN